MVFWSDETNAALRYCSYTADDCGIIASSERPSGEPILCFNCKKCPLSNVETHFKLLTLLYHHNLFTPIIVFFTSGLVLFSSKLFWTSGDQGWLKAYDILSNSTEER